MIYRHKNKEFIVLFKHTPKGEFVDYDCEPDPEERRLVSVFDSSDNDVTKQFEDISKIEESIGVNPILEEIEEQMWLEDIE